MRDPYCVLLLRSFDAATYTHAHIHTHTHTERYYERLFVYF